MITDAQPDRITPPVPTPAQTPLGADLTPLALPALGTSVVMLALGALAVFPLGHWMHDYGIVLVLTAYMLYIACFTALAAWGFTQLNHHRLDEDEPGL
ncbi:hypothetical protein [Nocardia caishijiensis]|uniref:Uncharacterized protein n=1 Tax=Nocardia caishijiensis TaxID=184756 RepID=A0ABQ6YI27_9NOCA|nr:hypothetical protein [Nocardia caishijiensis]KAF0845442.1 hypothetical protein FNL39_10743 [Nocardia caishijiensis]